MGRAPCCEKSGLKKGPWTPEEDQKLIDYISKNGYGNWRTLPTNAGLERCGKSCRLRWTNYLRPDIKRGRFSFEEEETVIQLHSILGNKWSAIAARLPGRTDNEIKNYWNTHIRKRLLRMGIDPVTHSPRLDLLDLSSILYHNNQTSSRLMDMHQSSSPSSSSVSTHPANYILRIAATSIMSSQPDNMNMMTNFYPQTTHSDPIFDDPTRMLESQYYYDTQHEQLDHHHPQSSNLIQIQALQKQVANDHEYELQSARFQTSNVTHLSYPSHDSDYVPVPFTDFYNGSNQNHIQNNYSVFLGQPAEGQNLSMNNSVISTPSSSPNSNVYMNSSCISTEDEKEINNNRVYHCNNDFVTMMMKFDNPDQIFDVNDFI